MKKLALTPFLFFLISEKSFAEIKLPTIVSSGMILQRDADVVIWGWSDEKEVTFSCSWQSDEQVLKVDKDGNWKLTVKTTKSKEPQQIKLQDASSSVDLADILFGEVWLCSGQSNMEMQLKGNKGQPVFGVLEAQLKAHKTPIRLYRAWNSGSKEPAMQHTNYQGWTAANSNSVQWWTAVGYFFAEELYDYLDVPIGLISVAKGGSFVQAWMSKEVLERYEQVDIADADFSPRKINRIPTALYNGMVNPLIPYTIRGAIWYQGEANRSEPKAYTKLFPAMVADWRSKWGQGDFPFYFAQIAPFRYGGNKAYEVHNNSAFIREAQLACANLIPNSAIAITLDVGDENCIHPPKKKEVAQRLALHALKNTYAAKGLESDSPTFASLENKDGGLLLSFDHAERGLYAYDRLEGFEIAGKDQVFYPAAATITNWSQVFVESPEVLSPVAVRYAWDNWVIGTLYNTFMLPASSFRSDNWDDATRSK